MKMLVPRIRRVFSAIAKSSASTGLVRPQRTGANLTKDQILEIEELLIAGQSGREIARRFGVSRHIIWMIDRAMPGPSSPSYLHKISQPPMPLVKSASGANFHGFPRPGALKN